MREVTVGLDIGTTSVKALAVDADGTVLARARVPHEVQVPSAGRLTHDVTAAWRDGPRRALDALGSVDPRAVAVAAMVPSLGPVDAGGAGVGPGLLYGDERGRCDDLELPAELEGEAVGFLRWLAAEVPDAVGYWPAQAVANASLAGRAVIDAASAGAMYPLYDGSRWDPEQLAIAGARDAQLPAVAPVGEAIGGLDGSAVVASGLVDAVGEQVVSGADEAGDVLVICGTTLLTWIVGDTYQPVDRLMTIPHAMPGRFLTGGPSNAGGLFLDWVRRTVGAGRLADDALAGANDPHRVPVWVPYLRGERVPVHDPARRASLHGLDLTHRPDDLLRAAHEASGFAVRHQLDLADVTPRRIVATGGGVADDRWLQAIADATGVVVDVVATPEGAALGAAFVARMAAGLEDTLPDAARWARTGRRVEPRGDWVGPVADRYATFRTLVGV